MSQKIKQTIIALVIIAIAFFGFKAFFASDSTGDVALVSEGSSTSQFVDGKTILVLLNKLSRITLDDSIFSNQIFTGLVNFEKPIEDQVIGRQNPFLPIGVDGSGLIVPKATTTVPKTR
jgi:hypothetical protein